MVSAEIANVSHISPEDPISVEHKIYVQFDERELEFGREKKQVNISEKELKAYIGALDKSQAQLKMFIDMLEKK